MYEFETKSFVSLFIIWNYNFQIVCTTTVPNQPDIMYIKCSEVPWLQNSNLHNSNHPPSMCIPFVRTKFQWEIFFPWEWLVFLRDSQEETSPIVTILTSSSLSLTVFYPTYHNLHSNVISSDFVWLVGFTTYQNFQVILC